MQGIHTVRSVLPNILDHLQSDQMFLVKSDRNDLNILWLGDFPSLRLSRCCVLHVLV